MIIRAVRAENLLKYAQLTLSGLPETGLIGISGPNESGKSSIGEILCFGLFGRSYAVAPEALSELLKWGERAGSVEVDFSDGAGVEYTVSRYLDADGVQSASLARAGEVLVRGVASVDAAVSELLGLTYGEFIDTFYLAQREILLPHAQGATVRSIVGLDRLERVGQELNAELGREREAIERLKREVASLRLQVMDLNVEEGVLGRLEAERAGAESGIGQAEQEAAGLIEAQTAVQRAFAQLHDATEGLLSLDANTSLQQCREHASSLATAASALECARRALAIDERLDIIEHIDQVLGSLKEHEAACQSLCQRCEEYREQLAFSLGERPGGERPGGEAPSQEPSLPQMHRQVMCQISEIEARCQRLSSVQLACWSAVFLLLAVAGAAVGLMLFVNTEWHAWLADTWPEATSYADTNLHSWRVFMVPAAIALVGMVDFVFFFRSQRLSKRLNELQGHSGQLIERMAVTRGEARVLDNLAVVPFPVAVAALRSMPGQALVHSLTELAQQHPLLNIAALSELKDKLHTAIGACRREVLEWDGRIAVRLKEVHERLAALQGDVERTEGMLRVEHQRGDRAARLIQAQGELEHRIACREQSVQVHERALQFLAEAWAHMIERFNERLGRLSAEVLPVLTGGRYRRLQCDAMLNLHAFSREEKGLLPLAQLPDTVQRCAGLLLRRMKADVEKADIEKAGAELPRPTWLLRTFVLDDPLPGEALSAAQIQALSAIAGENVQLWLLSAEFRRGSRIQARIKCSRRRKTLTFAARSKNISRETGRRAHWHCSSGESVHATGVG